MTQTARPTRSMLRAAGGPDLSLEILHGREKGVRIAGTDEAGRGPLAGPVVAAAVLIPPSFPEDIAALINDSKALPEKKREMLFPLIQNHCPHGIAAASAEEIDTLNILQASLLAMRRAFAALLQSQEDAAQNDAAIPVLLVDGNKCPPIANVHTIPVIKGDSKSLSIAAASILAKVTRDKLMRDLHESFPHYGWAKNMGYPTKDHLDALAVRGVSPHHRRSFAPVRDIIEKTDQGA